MEYEIREGWEEYYNFLEAIRRTGVCNMYGAAIYLVECFELTDEEAKEILCNWMENYDELSKKYDWR
jgi:hypothetical protein